VAAEAPVGPLDIVVFHQIRCVARYQNEEKEKKIITIIVL
jgi:hypothetical protein